MLAFDRDALICDLAETYHILDYKALPPELVAVLASGLREDSRIQKKLNGYNIGPEKLLLAGIHDRLSILVWMRTQDGQNNVNRPPSVLDQMLGREEKKEITSFASPEEFNRRWEELTRS